MLTDAPDARRRVDEVLEWTVRSLADEFREVQGGWVARSRALPLVHSLNRLQVIAAVDPKDVVALADDHQADLAYRHVEVDDVQTAAALERLLVTPGSGWKLDREVIMVLDEPTASRRASDGEDRRKEVPPPAAPVRLDGEETDRLMRRWLVEEHFDSVPGALDQMLEHNRREGALWGEEVLGVREDGQPVALTKSRAHGRVGWVEDVYTVNEARRKGYARLLVSRAIDVARAAGHELTFIVADDNDWPKDLYADLGFRPIGWTWTLHRDLSR